MSDRYHDYERSDRRSSMGAQDEPPNSRLFIVGPRDLTENDYRDAFNGFGKIEELRIVKDRQTGESKGITYIKYSKTSEAAKAMEEMNGRSVVEGTRSIKVMIAASREQGSKRDSNEEERIQRLFVVVPRDMTDKELYDYFKQFGEIDYANIVRDKSTKESKGVAYVKYFKFYHAALAYEQCERKYKPVFAEPRKPNVAKDDRQSFSFTSSDLISSRSSLPSLLPPPPSASNSHGTESFTKLRIIASPTVNQDQLWKLFDIVPSMDYCIVRHEGDRMRPTRAFAEVVYTNAQWANHAVEKLHGFEFPPGSRLIVKPVFDGTKGSSIEQPAKPDIMQLAETIAHASSLIQAAGLNPDILKVGLKSTQNDSFCSRKLPDPQPLGDVNQPAAARLFIVCSPTPIPNPVLKDVFSRFGDLLEIYLLPNKNCGYAKYASKSSAEKAIETLHGSEVLGIRLKVMEAEEKGFPQRKRLKTSDS